MTNAEKYLKDEKYIFDISKGIAEAICYDDMEHLKKITEKEIKDWFTSNTKPTLTEDERVILRNIKTHCDKIGRDENSILYLGNCNTVYKDRAISGYYNHLFQFIKERRRILNRGAFERRIEMEQEISEEEMQKLSAHPEDGVYGLCCCVNYLYNEIKKLKARTEKNIV